MQGLPRLQSKWIIPVLLAVRCDPFGSTYLSAAGLFHSLLCQDCFHNCFVPGQSCLVLASVENSLFTFPKLPKQQEGVCRTLCGRSCVAETWGPWKLAPIPMGTLSCRYSILNLFLPLWICFWLSRAFQMSSSEMIHQENPPVSFLVEIGLFVRDRVPIEHVEIKGKDET